MLYAKVRCMLSCLPRSSPLKNKTKTKKSQSEFLRELKLRAFMRCPTTWSVHKTIPGVSQRTRQPEHESMLRVCVCVFVWHTVNHVSRKSQMHDQKPEMRAECEQGYKEQSTNIIITSQLRGHHSRGWRGRMERRRRIGHRMGDTGVNYESHAVAHSCWFPLSFFL